MAFTLCDACFIQLLAGGSLAFLNVDEPYAWSDWTGAHSTSWCVRPACPMSLLRSDHSCGNARDAPAKKRPMVVLSRLTNTMFPRGVYLDLGKT
jgi:hypothetical protein